MRRTGTIERIGVAEIESLFLRLYGWVFREQFVEDYGIDAYLELAGDSGPNGKLIALQIKTGQSYLRYNSENGITYYIDPKHYRYWTSYSLPVLILIYDEIKQICYWEVVNETKIESTATGYKISIPLSNTLSAEAKPLIEKIVEVPLSKIKFNNLVVHRSLMRSIWKNDKRIIVEIDEWINKSSGRGDFKFYLEDDGELEEIEEWNWQIFPGWDYPTLFTHLFPWADLSLDEDVYHYTDYEDYEEECGKWDSEDQKFYFFRSFEDWKMGRSQGGSGIRPYKNSAGEVDSYRLVLTLNKLGKSFLVVSEYIDESE